ncbi:enoyl-CoA hydratase-related protein [Dactylosporangium sp. NPDC048998]|uniref:enoyl-CoA hydratase-related protein n=1 Tax=Dactylosporangium sp. NPDC048998 TaxID=3363976 RepID=UPI0037163E91
MPSLVTVERHAAAAVLTLNDPDRRNILTSALVAEIGEAMDELESEPEVRAVVVTGAGPAFCAGAELATLERAAAGDFSLIRAVYGGFLRILHSPLLTVGAVNGVAVGAGFNLALACDIRMAADSARFVCRFSELGILPGGGHTWMLSRAVGAQRAMLGVLLGEAWDAAAALRDGLVADVVPADRLLPATLERLRRLAGLEPEYVRRLVGAVRAAPGLLRHGDALELEAVDQEWSVGRPAFLQGLEGVRASIRRRPS